MITKTSARPIEILLVEDNEGDARLAGEALMEAKVRNNVSWVSDGAEAMRFLRREGRHASAPEPDVILLDLNLPGMDGREVLTEIKKNKDLHHIPVVVLSSSSDDEDVARSYDLHANCYITKPIDLDQFLKVVRAIEDFWFSIVKLPSVAETPRRLAATAVRPLRK
ncbi:response regulator [Candidatus Bipolaricaulota bacterium]|nr:response regulator [Candidatus Bipolaricaulota bacterium]